MKQILVMAPCRREHREMLEQAAQGSCHFIYNEHPSLSDIESAEVIIGQPAIPMLQDCTRLQWVQMTCAGADMYTRFPGFPEQVTLTTASGAFGSVIAEYAFAGILSLFRHLSSYREQQQLAVWQDCGPERTIEGSEVLILGAGDIGENIARRMQAFGATVTGIRRTVCDLPEGFDAMAGMHALDALLAQADIVVCCLPHTPETVHLLNRERLMRMKPEAVLVNVGRGTLIDTNALADVIANGHMLGAVLDVTDPEPLPADHPLWSFDRVVLTPHIAGPSFHHSPLTEDKIFRICSDNLSCYLAGQPLHNVVNWQTGYSTP